MSSSTTPFLVQLIRKVTFSKTWRNMQMPKTPKINSYLNSHSSVYSRILPSRLQWILNVAPAFPVFGSKISIITTPEKFYEELLRRASISTKRVVLASLYLGTGELEKDLVLTINERMSKCETLRVRWLLDYTRGSRGDISSRSILLPMLSNNPSKCQVALYHTPNLRGFLRKIVPQRWNETIGLQHMKLYIFDDSLIISGANLSNDYFTNRQDRYVVFEDCKELVDFYEKVVETISHYSFNLLPNNDTAIQPLSGIHPLTGGKDYYCSIVAHSIHSLWNEYCSSNSTRLQDFEKSSDELKTVPSCDTIVFPTLQMGPFNINYDDAITRQLLTNADDNSLVKLASGYFNLTEDYMSCILQGSKTKFDILCAHPKANGFLGAKGFAGAIPTAYTHLAKLFYNRVSESKQNWRINLHEYQREGWTFHGKGLWYYLPNMHTPVLTMIGSPNFGWRSKSRDLESQVIVVTQNENLQSTLHKEQQNLYGNSDLVTKKTYQEENRSVPYWVQFVMPIIKAFF